MGSCFKNIFRWEEVFSLQQLLAWQAAQVRRNQGGGGLLQLWSLAFVAFGLGRSLTFVTFGLGWRLTFVPLVFFLGWSLNFATLVLSNLNLLKYLDFRAEGESSPSKTLQPI